MISSILDADLLSTSTPRSVTTFGSTHRRIRRGQTHHAARRNAHLAPLLDLDAPPRSYCEAFEVPCHLCKFHASLERPLPCFGSLPELASVSSEDEAFHRLRRRVRRE